jgi:uncharacterized delta-60 repeat protein
VAGDVMLARLTRTGKLDQAFSDDGVEMSDFGTSYDNATDLALQPDGFVVVVGASGAGFPASGVPGDAFVARYRPDGTPDPTFGASGRVVLGRAASDAYLDAQAVALLPDGSILVGGNAGVTQRDGNAAAIALLRPNGTPDTRLGPLGISYPGLGDGVLYDLVRDRRSGRVYIAGTVRTETGPEFFLMALSPDLSRDDSFGEFGVVRSSLSGTSGEFATTAVVDGKGRVLLAGTTLRSSTPKSMGSFAVARFLDTGQVDNGFGHRGWVRTSFARGWSVARAVLLQRGRLLAVGNKASTELWSTGSVITLARYRLGG